MEAFMEIRKCKECGAKLVGRTDQKYCDQICRTAGNNRRIQEERRSQPECIITIQKTLLNNYRILTELAKRGERFSKMYLQDLGFSFRYLTSVSEQEGSTKCFCFNQGYIMHDQSITLLIENTPMELNR